MERDSSIVVPMLRSSSINATILSMSFEIYSSEFAYGTKTSWDILEMLDEIDFESYLASNLKNISRGFEMEVLKAHRIWSLSAATIMFLSFFCC